MASKIKTFFFCQQVNKNFRIIRIQIDPNHSDFSAKDSKWNSDRFWGHKKHKKQLYMEALTVKSKTLQL